MLRGASETIPEGPGTLPRRVGQRSDGVFRDVRARTRFRIDFRTIFRDFCVARGTADMRFVLVFTSRNACRAFSVARARARRKRTQSDRKTVRKSLRNRSGDPLERSGTPSERPGERSLAQDGRFFGKRSERRRGAAQRERFGGAVGAPDLRVPWDLIS